MHRLGLDPGRIDVMFVTHFHGDHVLGLPPFLLQRALVSKGRLDVVGPPGIEERLGQLLDLAWAGEWSALSSGLTLCYHEAVGQGTVAGIPYTPVALDHGTIGCTGYRLRLGSRVLAYAGDSEPTEALDRLVEGADVAIVEATAPGSVHSHTGWEEARQLRDRHPGTLFFFNHLYAGDLEGAAGDLQTVNV